MEPLPDPLDDRERKDVLAPPQFPMGADLLYLPGTNTPNLKLLRDHLIREGRLKKSDLLDLVERFIQIVKKEPNVLMMEDPVTVVGDIHGQFYDVPKIFEVGGDPKESKYLFLGDYVDRGMFSLEVCVYLYALKITYPNTVYMIRGNHECRQLTTFFNFKQECEMKYDNQLYEKMMDSFDGLPLACVINDKFPCVHEPPKEGAFCDLLWADPCENDNEAAVMEWVDNKVRGCSYVFGSKAVTPFLNNNDYLSVLRAHEAQLEGFKMYNWDDTCDFPSVITIFSAPNYCDVYNNKGAIIKIKENMVNLQQFNYSAHPFILPNFQNIFNWSLPFISEKINEMLLHLIKKEKYAEEGDVNSNVDPSISSSLRSKIKFVTMMTKLMKTLREENELIVKIKGLCPGNKIPRGVILQGPLALKSAYEKYKKAKELDSVNEKYPDLKDIKEVKDIKHK